MTDAERNAVIEECIEVVKGLRWYSTWPMDTSQREPTSVTYRADIEKALAALQGAKPLSQMSYAEMRKVYPRE